MIGRACQNIRQWDANGSLPGVGIAVNVSADSFVSGRVLDALRHHVAECGIDPARLEIEITESVLVRDIEQVSQTLAEIRSLGHPLSLDDFGTGYSSLTYLQRFPIDKLKIDQAFVRDLENQPEQQALCSSIIALASSMQMGTVAEGVENRAQLEMLLKLGCDQLQGYYLHRPEPAAAFSAQFETDAVPRNS